MKMSSHNHHHIDHFPAARPAVRTNLALLSVVCALIGLLALALAFSGCATTPIGVIEQEAGGDLYANYELGSVTTAAQAQTIVSALNRLQTDLPLIPAGKVSQGQLGALNEQLSEAKAGIPVNASNQKIVDDLASLIDLVAQGISGTGNGGLTAGQGLLIANFTNAAQGIKAAIEYQEGKWSVSHPDWIPAK